MSNDWVSVYAGASNARRREAQLAAQESAQQARNFEPAVNAYWLEFKQHVNDAVLRFEKETSEAYHAKTAVGDGQGSLLIEVAGRQLALSLNRADALRPVIVVRGAFEASYDLAQAQQAGTLHAVGPEQEECPPERLAERVLSKLFDNV
jgi:DNA-dependent RNA polymerase auxiliary subunit epsilon